MNVDIVWLVVLIVQIFNIAKCAQNTVDGNSQTDESISSNSNGVSNDDPESEIRERRGTEGSLVLTIPNPDHPDPPTRQRRDSHEESAAETNYGTSVSPTTVNTTMVDSTTSSLSISELSNAAGDRNNETETTNTTEQITTQAVAHLSANNTNNGDHNQSNNTNFNGSTERNMTGNKPEKTIVGLTKDIIEKELNDISKNIADTKEGLEKNANSSSTVNLLPQQTSTSDETKNQEPVANKSTENSTIGFSRTKSNPSVTNDTSSDINDTGNASNSEKSVGNLPNNSTMDSSKSSVTLKNGEGTSVPQDFLRAVNTLLIEDKEENKKPVDDKTKSSEKDKLIRADLQTNDTNDNRNTNTSTIESTDSQILTNTSMLTNNESGKRMVKRESPALDEPHVIFDVSEKSPEWSPDKIKYQDDGGINPFQILDIIDKEESVLNGPSLGEGPQEISNHGVLTEINVPYTEESSVEQDTNEKTQEERIIKDEVKQIEEYEKIKIILPDEPPRDPIDENELLWFELKEEEKRRKEIEAQVRDGDSGRRRRRSIRRKRFLNIKPTLRWTKGIVPYTFDSSLDEKGRNDVLATMARFEKYTCIRYVPHEGEATRKKYGLDHDSFMIFVKASGCWAQQGNKRKKGGQKVSCCNRLTCIHELGHAMGLYHEHQSPMRKGWNRVNWKNIERSGYKWYKEIPVSDVLAYGYDFTNPMHYGRTEFGNGKGPTQSVLFKELQSISHGYHNPFYLFAEVSRSHQCDKLHCTSFKGKCLHGGYLTLVNGKCVCNCPSDLDPSTNCATILKKLKPANWPKGSYSLLEPKEGCSNGFAKGYIKHWSLGHSMVGKPFNLTGDYTSSMFNHHFCTVQDRNVGEVWERGQYCIFRKGGKCPKGFIEGSVQFDDSPTQAGQSVKPEVKGAVPDGNYEVETKIETCCRDDGYIDEAISLPLDKPFVLLPLVSYRDCQHVKGALPVNEFFRFANDKSGNAKLSGLSTYVLDVYNKYRTHFCYYVPYKRDCGGVISLTNAKPEVTFTSPGYPKAYENAQECTWLLKGPTNSNLVLKFEDFDLETDEKRCKDSVEIRYNEIGQTGFKFCGDKFYKSITSINNFIVFIMKTDMVGVRKGFKAKVKLVTPKDMCFNVTDRGRTYRGKVNHDRDFRPCIAWRKTTNCDYHQYQTMHSGAPLEGNYCRNPDDTLKPWCYIQNSEGECERNYCDACGFEEPYDKVPDCEKLKSEGFCSKPKEEILAKCAKTCQESTADSKPGTKVGDVKCSPPPPLEDSEQEGERKSSYSVGDEVKYKCKTGNESHVILCLSDGSWSPGQYVCGACTSGWIASGGVCLKYFNKQVTFIEASNICSQYGGTVADAKTKKQSDFLVSLRAKTMTMWIGLNDKETEGVYKWSDGSPLVWKDWSKGSPNNNFNAEDCVIMYGEQLENKWNDHPCSSRYYKYTFTCQIKPSKRVICRNRRDDCKAMLQAYPKMCKELPDFSSENCALDCGICKPKAGSASKLCQVEAATENAILVTKSKTVSLGNVATYRCKSGFSKYAGDLSRSCMTDGKLSGKPLSCKSAESMTEASNNVKLHRYVRIGNQCQMYTGINDNFRIKRKGEIKQWEFYSLKSGEAAFVVFRQTNDKFKFKMIGINRVLKTKDDKLETLPIPPKERIRVEPNDLIGIWYARQRAGIPFEFCQADNHPEAANSLQLANFLCRPDGLQINKIFSFNSKRITCRIFSFRAKIGPISA